MSVDKCSSIFLCQRKDIVYIRTNFKMFFHKSPITFRRQSPYLYIRVVSSSEYLVSTLLFQVLQCAVFWQL